jgi:peptidoglycan-N-acetylglucosamine deacetylase
MSLVIATSCAATLGGLYAASCFAEVRGIHDWLVPGAQWRTRQAHCVLTFDDGPHVERTPRLLDILAAHGAKAVFFVVGREAKKYPALIRRIAEEGHQLGNHSWTHPWMIRLGRQGIRSEVTRCQEILGMVTGQVPTLARPPYGQKDFRYYRILRDLNLTPILWSRNLRDYWGTSAHVLQTRLARAQPGDILLLHDGDDKARHTLHAVDGWLKTRPAVGLLDVPG